MNNTAEKLHELQEPTDMQWFGNQPAVFACLSRMIKDGWVPCNTYKGVVHDNFVARPVKVHGSKYYTGVALYEILT